VVLVFRVHAVINPALSTSTNQDGFLNPAEDGLIIGTSVATLTVTPARSLTMVFILLSAQDQQQRPLLVQAVVHCDQ
jgi:hypothetical protein